MSNKYTSKVDFGSQSGFNTGAGKGDAERPVNRAKYRENWDAIFGKNKTLPKPKKPV
jgi:hypothetical protein